MEVVNFSEFKIEIEISNISAIRTSSCVLSLLSNKFGRMYQISMKVEVYN